MKKTILTVIVASLFAVAPAKKIFEDLAYNLRVGYSIGGTAPLDMPASIRKLNKYTLTNNLQLGIDARRKFNDTWGVLAGVHFENKGMNEDAQVKNYKMKLVRGGQSLEGRFTGDVKTCVSRVDVYCTGHGYLFRGQGNSQGGSLFFLCSFAFFYGRCP